MRLNMVNIIFIPQRMHKFKNHAERGWEVGVPGMWEKMLNQAFRPELAWQMVQKEHFIRDRSFF